MRREPPPAPTRCRSTSRPRRRRRRSRGNLPNRVSQAGRRRPASRASRRRASHQPLLHPRSRAPPPFYDGAWTDPGCAAAGRGAHRPAGQGGETVSEKLFVVTGASGHIGRRLTGLLLEGHRRVRVVARREEQLLAFAERGAEAFPGDLQDASFTRRAFAGAHAAFTMIPPVIADHDLRGVQNRISEAIAFGLGEARVPYVVNLSSWGAEVPYGTGPIAGLHDHEERLDRLDATHIVHLRPASFMENHLHAVGAILQAGIYPSTLRGDLPLSMIATRDVAAEAARLLAGLEFEGKSTQSLLGP